MSINQIPYFVSFYWSANGGGGFGNTALLVSRPIATMDQILQLQQNLAQDFEKTLPKGTEGPVHITVMNFRIFDVPPPQVMPARPGIVIPHGR